MSRTSWIVLGVVLFFLQASVIPFWGNGVWQPDLWLVAIVISSLIYDRQAVFFLALAGGLLQDIVIGNFFGLHLFPYMVVAFLGIWWGRERYNRQWFISMAAVMGGTVVFTIAAAFLVFIGSDSLRFGSYLLHVGMPLMMMNGTAALPMHYVLWEMKREKEQRW